MVLYIVILKIKFSGDVMKKKLFISMLLSSLILASAFADSMQDITKSIRSVCVAPDQKGKYWSVKALGDAKIKIKILGVKTKVGGEVSLKEWDGIKEILKKQQAGENKNYRDCVKFITPIFLKNFKENNNIKTPILIKNNDFSLDLSAYEEGDIAEELGKELVISKVNDKMAISGLQSDPSGEIEIRNINLKNKFRVEIINDVNTSDIDFILRTRDDDIDNDIKVRIKGGYIIFADTKTSLNDSNIEYKTGKNINEFVIYMKNGVVKFYINDKYFDTKKLPKNLVYNKLIIKQIAPKDYIYDISGYNINN